MTLKSKQYYPFYFWTDRPIPELGDFQNHSKIRNCKITRYFDNGRDVEIYVVEENSMGVFSVIDSKYVYHSPGRYGDVPSVTIDDILTHAVGPYVSI